MQTKIKRAVINIAGMIVLSAVFILLGCCFTDNFFKEGFFFQTLRNVIVVMCFSAWVVVLIDIIYTSLKEKTKPEERLYLALGMSFLCIGIIFNYFFNHNNFLKVLSILFILISLILNLYYIRLFMKKKKTIS